MHVQCSDVLASMNIPRYGIGNERRIPSCMNVCATRTEMRAGISELHGKGSFLNEASVGLPMRPAALGAVMHEVETHGCIIGSLSAFHRLRTMFSAASIDPSGLSPPCGSCNAV